MPTKQMVEFTPERKLKFLEHLRHTGSQVLSAEMVGVAARTVRDHMQRDKEFAEAYQQANNFYTDEYLVKPATERAVHGVRKPIIGGKDRDQIVTHVQEYSDTLMLALLRSRKTEFNKGADDGAGGAGSGSSGGVLIVAQAPHTLDEWEKLFGQKAKGTTGRPEEA